MPKKDKNELKYTKVNATPESSQVLNIIAAEKRLYVYEVLDKILREHCSEYFRQIGCWNDKKTKGIIIRKSVSRAKEVSTPPKPENTTEIYYSRSRSIYQSLSYIYGIW